MMGAPVLHKAAKRQGLDIANWSHPDQQTQAGHAVTSEETPEESYGAMAAERPGDTDESMPVLFTT